MNRVAATSPGGYSCDPSINGLSGSLMPPGPGRGAGTKRSPTPDKFDHVSGMFYDDTCSLSSMEGGEIEEAFKGQIQMKCMYGMYKI